MRFPDSRGNGRFVFGDAYIPCCGSVHFILLFIEWAHTKHRACLKAMKKCFRIFHIAQTQQSAVVVYNVDPDTSRTSIVHSVADFMQPQLA